MIMQSGLCPKHVYMLTSQADEALMWIFVPSASLCVRGSVFVFMCEWERECVRLRLFACLRVRLSSCAMLIIVFWFCLYLVSLKTSFISIQLTDREEDNWSLYPSFKRHIPHPTSFLLLSRDGSKYLVQG